MLLKNVCECLNAKMLKYVFKGLNVENVYEGVGKEHLARGHTVTDWLKCFCIYRLKCSKAIGGTGMGSV